MISVLFLRAQRAWKPGVRDLRSAGTLRVPRAKLRFATVCGLREPFGFLG
jgi:hypothetical protein